MSPAAAERFGTLPDGRAVEAVTLGNGRGLRVRVIAFGAIVQAIEVPDRDGQPGDVVLGYPDLAGYLADTGYIGATVGRYANRIAGGRFVLDGQACELVRNDGPNTLHGGAVGFGKRLWTVADIGDDRLTLRYLSPDGEEGFPGALDVSAGFALGDDSLTIDYRATTDRATIVNLTGHGYFNLAGEGRGDVLGHRLTIPAAHFIPVDARLIPTGELREVAGTPFDFRAATALGARIRQADEQLLRGRGYDHTLVVAGAPSPEPRLHARVEEPGSGRVLEVWSDQPGLQLYSGNSLDGSVVGKAGRAYRQGDGLCLEPQLFPDTPNRPGFGSARLAPGETYRHQIVYRFGVAS